MATMTTEEFWTKLVPALANYELDIEEGNEAAIVAARNYVVTLIIEMVGDHQETIEIGERMVREIADWKRKVTN